MTKMGKPCKREMEIEQVICIAHTIHLVACDVFYKKPRMMTNNLKQMKMMIMITIKMSRATTMCWVKKISLLGLINDGKT